MIEAGASLGLVKVRRPHHVTSSCHTPTLLVSVAQGKSPLHHLADRHSHSDTIRDSDFSKVLVTLFLGGADPNALDASGKTPLRTIIEQPDGSSSKDVIALFLACGATVPAGLSIGDDALKKALDIVKKRIADTNGSAWAKQKQTKADLKKQFSVGGKECPHRAVQKILTMIDKTTLTGKRLTLCELLRKKRAQAEADAQGRTIPRIEEALRGEGGGRLLPGGKAVLAAAHCVARWWDLRALETRALAREQEAAGVVERELTASHAAAAYITGLLPV